MLAAETLLLQQCRLKYKERKDFGNEYFEGDVYRITRTLLEVAEHFPQPLGPATSFAAAVETAMARAAELASATLALDAPVAEWLKERVEVTGVRTDYVVIGTLKVHYANSKYAVRSSKDFSRQARAILRAMPGVIYDENATIASKSLRGVARGVRMSESTMPPHVDV